LQHNRVL